MSEELLSFDIPLDETSIIKVIGVGGGGSNAVNYMYELGIKDVNFVVCNTDAQALKKSPVPLKIQLGASLTEGRGAGNKPQQGKQAAIESLDKISSILEDNTKMVFITAGMGGGTGTGAAPVIAKAAKDKGILTVGIVTIPFKFEGPVRINQAIEGIAEMKDYVDSLLVINNEKLREIHGNLRLSEAFKKTDNILSIAAKGIAEIITVHGYVNVDFEDVKTVMKNSGVSIMGSASAQGESRAISAISEALSSPLLNNNDIRGAKNILLNITSGDEEITMDEVGEITDYVLSEVGTDTNIIWGNGHDESLGDMLNVTIIATGFDSNSIPELGSYTAKAPAKVELVPVTVTKEETCDIVDEIMETIEASEEVEQVETVSEIVAENISEEHTEEIVEETKVPEMKKPMKIEEPLLDFTTVSAGESKQVFVAPVNSQHEYKKETEVKKHAVEETEKTIKDRYDKLKALSNLTDANIEKLENEPAHLRMKKATQVSQQQKEESDNMLSSYTISTDANNNTQLRKDNPFFEVPD